MNSPVGPGGTPINIPMGPGGTPLDPGNMRGMPDPILPATRSPTSAAGPSREELARLVTSPMDRIDATVASSWKNRPWWLGGGG
jgi:hypothetical protein